MQSQRCLEKTFVRCVGKKFFMFALLYQHNSGKDSTYLQTSASGAFTWSAVFRHHEIDDDLARKICKDPGIASVR